MRNADIVIIGAGISGSVLAERYANAGKKVLVIEKRNHIAGNCYDYIDDNGILVSKYGTHLFHIDYLDILGFNYYWNSQWEDGTGTLPWPETVPCRNRISTMLKDAYLQYGKPILLSETGHFGEGRALWIEEIAKESYSAIIGGIPLLGVCIYPVTERPDWDDLSAYSNCGVFDLDDNNNRIPHFESILAINTFQAMIEAAMAEPETRIPVVSIT